MENLNLVELLRDCPTGMELDCTIFDNVVLDEINFDKDPDYPIRIVTKSGTMLSLSKYGTYVEDTDAKCVIFPKGKTTWEGFHRPFEDGDILYVDCTEECDDKQYDYIFIFNKIYNSQVYSYCHYYIPHDDFKLREDGIECLIDDKYPIRPATEEEKQKLFDAIKANGYKWNSETKTLEELVKPRFKVGDRIKYKNGRNKDGVKEGIILSITDDTYDVAVTNDMGVFIPIANQDNWELIPNKFDINTLKPFDKVLGRDKNTEKWLSNFWGFYDIDNAIHECCGNSFVQCIPYEHNEHLLGTANDCDDFYKTWEK